MFSYYGSKSKIVHLYPTPKFDKIIEPFAGSARYSLKYWQKDILLIDKYENIVKIWLFLQQASKNDILSLPKLQKGDNLKAFDLSDTEILFLQYVTQHGTVGGFKVSEWGARDLQRNLKTIASNLHKIKHWKIKQGDYKDLQNENATWFVDAPYQFGGHKYKCSNKDIDFLHLSEWCKSRNGQVIVCENTKADWLQFNPIIKMQGIQFETTEAIWSNQKTNFDYKMASLF